MDEKHIEAERARFEAMVKATHPHWSLGRDSQGDYLSDGPDYAWLGWKLARATQGSAPADVLEEVWALVEQYADEVVAYNEAVRVDAGIDKAGKECLAIESRLKAALATHLRPAPAAQQAPGWLPIESAPKDAKAILLGSRGGAWIGKWLPVYQSGYRPENPWSSLMLNHDHMGEKWCKPTHWMPLPPAPQQQGGGNA